MRHSVRRILGISAAVLVTFSLTAAAAAVTPDHSDLALPNHSDLALQQMGTMPQALGPPLPLSQVQILPNTTGTNITTQFASYGIVFTGNPPVLDPAVPGITPNCGTLGGFCPDVLWPDPDSTNNFPDGISAKFVQPVSASQIVRRRPDSRKYTRALLARMITTRGAVHRHAASRPQDGQTGWYSLNRSRGLTRHSTARELQADGTDSQLRGGRSAGIPGGNRYGNDGNRQRPETAAYPRTSNLSCAYATPESGRPAAEPGLPADAVR